MIRSKTYVSPNYRGQNDYNEFGENLNPFNKETEYHCWLEYEKGFLTRVNDDFVAANREFNYGC